VHLRTITLFFVLPLFAATPAHAESKSVDEANATEKKEAGGTYTNAMADFDKSEFEKALTGFRDSYHRVRSPNSHFMIARTLARLGRNAEAYAELDAVIAEADALGEHYAGTAHAAREKREEIRPRVALITVQVAHAPKGTTYSVGGDAIAADKLGTPIAVLPGETKVVATPPGGAERAWTKTIQAGESETLDVDLLTASKTAATSSKTSFHPKYVLEIEPHFVGETLAPPGSATRGAGVGGRLALEVSATGLLGADDSFALTAGGDWIGTSTDPHVWIPLGIQWNIWILRDLSLFFEPGVALMVGAGTHGRPALDFGARYHVWRKLYVVGRIGIPGATIGASLLL
jgi:hypothetical protein